MLRRPAAAFSSHPEVAAVRVVIDPADRALYDSAVDGLGLLDPVAGGATRQDSSRLGLESFADAAPRNVLIHDAARPFVDSAMVSRVIGALADAPAAVPVLAVSDTLKRGNGQVAETVDRSGLWRAQTPQGFRYAEILTAHRDLSGQGLTDDAAVAERAGLAVAMVAGSEDNVKITTAEDLERARRDLGGVGEIRVGTGFDVHRFKPGDHVTLCGIRIPHDRALEGHSDADAGLHALTDALLGAIGAGDIGVHFPPSDARWKDADSEIFLREAAERVKAAGGAVLNADVTLICEAPRIGPHRTAMTERIAGILGISADRVNVKGTTTEKLGFLGRGEGIAAQAIVSVRINIF